MTRIIYLMGLLLLFVGQSLIAPAQVSNDNEDGVYKVDSRQANDYVPGQVLFKLRDGQKANVHRAGGVIQSAGIGSLDKVLSYFGVQDMEQLLPYATVAKTPRRAKAYNGDMIVERDLTQLYHVVLPEEKTDKTFEMIEQLQQLDEVEFAEPNYKMYIMADDNIAADYSTNPMVNQQWYLDAYGVKELWNKPIINKTRPVIAIIDTGVDITHPDLKDNIWTKEGTTDEHGYDFINNTTKMRDNNKHGTHVAGIAAAANNGIGIVGANPRALIMPVTVMQSDGTGDVATIIKGINYAVSNGATVLNLSLGTYANSSALRQALETAYQSTVIVAAAGNDRKCIYTSHWKKHDVGPAFPAAYSFVLGVQATTSGGGLASFSNYDDDGSLTSCESTSRDPEGFNYELKAPGTNILSCIPGGGYDELRGTSMAAPLVAGGISALQMVKEYDNQEILWGDLLHTNNIAEAFNVTARPAELDVMRILLRDRNEQTEYNEKEDVVMKYYDVNVGETLNIFPVVRSSFGKASNIKLRIIVPSGVEVVKNNIDFGYSLNAFGNMTSENPLVIKVPDMLPNASTINVTIEATCDESENTTSSSFNLRVCNMYTLKGLLKEDMTLTPDHVYYVSSCVCVDEGATLTIEPGTRLEFAKDAYLYGLGKLNIKGTPDKPIVFTAYNPEERWAGIFSHKNRDHHTYYEGKIYTNSDSTLFTMMPTNQTQNEVSGSYKYFYYDTEENRPKSLSITDYLKDWNKDMTGREALLTDPNYLTDAVLRMLNDWKGYETTYSTVYSTETPNQSYTSISFIPRWEINYDTTDTLYYCRLDCIGEPTSYFDVYDPYRIDPYYKDCILTKYINSWDNNMSNTIVYAKGLANPNNDIVDFCNYVNNETKSPYSAELGRSNVFNNFCEDYNKKKYMIIVSSRSPQTVKIDPLPYFGTSREDFLRPYICELDNNADIWWGETFATLDLSNITKQPYKEAHGIVWKVVVNGKDAQDEQEELLPLGIGKHKFEVYFNRPMNKDVIPQISFGPISPYNRSTVSEYGSWSADGTIYTAYITIDGKTRSDGMNRIYVHDAEDNEFFPCPYEATRFNIMVQAAGSMATGFQADAGLGCVHLTWNNENNDFEDAMGFNVYRFNPEVKRTIPAHYDENWNWIGETEVIDTIRINEDILDRSATTYIDDNVVPGTTYYYCYKVLSTALQEYDVSNVVAATPLTATRGDANGSGEVDVADVVTTVNYVIGIQPKPFVFDAADMNNDKMIDIFDVVGIIRGILNPSLLATASLDNETAIYSIENGTLYVESPVSLGGVQVQLTLDGRSNMDAVRVASDLTGFEQTSSWPSDTDYLFLAYSMNGKTLAPGKHALLHIGDADITSLRLSGTQGKKVNAISGDGITGIDRMGKHVMSVDGIYDLQGRKFSKDTPLKKGVYIINGRKVVK